MCPCVCMVAACETESAPINDCTDTCIRSHEQSFLQSIRLHVHSDPKTLAGLFFLPTRTGLPGFEMRGSAGRLDMLFLNPWFTATSRRPWSA